MKTEIEIQNRLTDLQNGLAKANAYVSKTYLEYKKNCTHFGKSNSEQEYDEYNRALGDRKIIEVEINELKWVLK